MGKFLSGDRYVPHRQLSLAFGDIWARFGAEGSWMNANGTLEEMRAFWAAPPRCVCGILDVLQVGRDFKATVGVDHIYGFFGHIEAKTKDGKSNIIEVDYNGSVEETNRLLVQQLLLTTRSLRLLCVVQHWDQDLEDIAEKKFPSWVPTFHLPNCYQFVLPHNTWDAALSGETSDKVLIAVKGHELTVTALLFDTVDKVSGPFPKDQNSLPQIIYDCWNIFTQAQNIDPKVYWIRFLWTLVQLYDIPDRLPSDFMEYCRRNCNPSFYQVFASQPYFENCLTSSPNSSYQRFADKASQFCAGRKIFMTRGGFCGMGLRPTREGDVLAVVFGCPMPILLRPAGVSSKYRFVGQVLVSGLMRGQVVEMWTSGKIQTDLQEVVLI